MKHFALCVLFLAGLSHNSIFSQEEELQLTSKDSIVKSSWMFGLGYNFVDDSGDMANKLFSFDSQWNAVPYPSRLSLGRFFKSGIGLEGIGSYNKYRVGKLIDGTINLQEKDYLSLDLRLSYDLNKIIGETAWFDSYVGIGLGYSDANNRPRSTYNTTIGFRTWFSDHWGLDLSSSGKWGLGENGATNHLQHAAGVVYRFGIEKELSKNGEEKLALIEALQAEKQQKLDSIAAASREKEAAALAERLAKEKETAQLAVAEKGRQDAENRRKQQIQDEIDALGVVYFDLNSSYLDNISKNILDALTVLLKKNDVIVLKVSSYTDSRGTSKYNDWLSKRRVQSTVAYLIKQGIVSERLQPEGFGEEHLLNECDDNTYCPEEKHKINRRSEFRVVKF